MAGLPEPLALLPRILHAPLTMWFTGVGISAAAFAAGVLLVRALAGRRSMWSAWLALPAAWSAFEFVRNFLWPHGSASCVAYSQLNFLPFLQTASLAGPWGMGFVLMLFPAGLALSVDRWRSKREPALRILAATFGVLAALLLLGAVRLEIPQRGPQVRVGLVASDANGGASLNDTGAPTQRLFENYALRARQLVARGAQLVVMPEDMGVVLDSDISKTDALFQPIADETGAVLVIGMARIGAAGRHNQASHLCPWSCSPKLRQRASAAALRNQPFHPWDFNDILRGARCLGRTNLGGGDMQRPGLH